LAFCAIIHRFRPQLIDFDSLEPGQVKRNCELAFSVADKSLGIPALLDPQDMEDSCGLDRLSILTYVSQFYHKFSKESPTPITRRSVISEKSSNDAVIVSVKDNTKDKDDENNNAATSDFSDLQPVLQTPSASSDFDEDSSSSPYSSSSSSGCYNLSLQNDKMNLTASDQPLLVQYQSSSKSPLEILSRPPALTAGKAGETAANEFSHKSSKSTKISESSLATHWNARKPQADQTLTDFTVGPPCGTLVFNDRQLPVISPTPSSTSSKASTASELTFITNTTNDSGLEQSSEMSSSSSPSSSRLSSVSPSSEKMLRNPTLPAKMLKPFIQRKSAKTRLNAGTEASHNTRVEQADLRLINRIGKDPVNNRIAADRIATANVKVSCENHETAELVMNNRATFKETLTKFNSLSTASDQPEARPAQERVQLHRRSPVRLKSQSSQTETVTVSQLVQTEESHLSSKPKQQPFQQPQRRDKHGVRSRRCGHQEMRRISIMKQMPAMGGNMYAYQNYPYPRYQPSFPYPTGVQSTLV